MNYLENGGISRYVYELSNIFSESNNVSMFSITYESSNPNIKFNRVSVINNPTLIKVMSFARKNADNFRKNRNNYDIIHTNGVDSAYQDIVTAQSCHKAWIKKYNKNKFGISLRPTDLIITRIEKNNYQSDNCKKIIAVSELTAKEIHEEYKTPYEKIKVIYHGVDAGKFKPDNQKRIITRKNLGYNESDFVLLFVGFEFKRKGLKHIIESLKYLPKDIKLCVVGDDNSIPYIRLAEKNDVLDRVKFIGPKNNISDFYNMADTFVFPSQYEPFGLVVFEAMASNIPVITNEVVGASELITNGKDGLLMHQGNAMEIAGNVSMIYNSENVRNDLGNNARKVALKHSWRYVAEETMKVYNELLES